MLAGLLFLLDAIAIEAFDVMGGVVFLWRVQQILHWVLVIRSKGQRLSGITNIIQHFNERSINRNNSFYILKAKTDNLEPFGA
jgi:hypothetical protein